MGSDSGDYLRITNASGVIVSVCAHCHIAVAGGPTIEVVELAEGVHNCEEKRNYYEAKGMSEA